MIFRNEELMKRYRLSLVVVSILLIFIITQGCDNDTPTSSTSSPNETSKIDLYLSDVGYYTYKGLQFTVHNSGTSNAENVQVIVITKDTLGNNYCNSYQFTVPAGGSVSRQIGPVGDASYLIIVDPDNRIEETNKSNNSACSGPLCSSPSLSICPL